MSNLPDKSSDKPQLEFVLLRDKLSAEPKTVQLKDQKHSDGGVLMSVILSGETGEEREFTRHDHSLFEGGLKNGIRTLVVANLAEGEVVKHAPRPHNGTAKQGKKRMRHRNPDDDQRWQQPVGDLTEENVIANN